MGRFGGGEYRGASDEFLSKVDICLSILCTRPAMRGCLQLVLTDADDDDESLRRGRTTVRLAGGAGLNLRDFS